MLCTEHTQAIAKLGKSDEPFYQDADVSRYIYSFCCHQQGFCGGLLRLGQHQPASWLSELEMSVFKVLLCVAQFEPKQTFDPTAEEIFKVSLCLLPTTIGDTLSSKR